MRLTPLNAPSHWTHSRPCQTCRIATTCPKRKRTVSRSDWSPPKPRVFAAQRKWALRSASRCDHPAAFPEPPRLHTAMRDECAAARSPTCTPTPTPTIARAQAARANAICWRACALAWRSVRRRWHSQQRPGPAEVGRKASAPLAAVIQPRASLQPQVERHSTRRTWSVYTTR